MSYTWPPSSSRLKVTGVRGCKAGLLDIFVRLDDSPTLYVDFLVVKVEMGVVKPDVVDFMLRWFALRIAGISKATESKFKPTLDKTS
ncbi:hypothetical protein Tco_0390275, partial [Tanacetum coccineum]